MGEGVGTGRSAADRGRLGGLARGAALAALAWAPPLAAAATGDPSPLAPAGGEAHAPSDAGPEALGARADRAPVSSAAADADAEMADAPAAAAEETLPLASEASEPNPAPLPLRSFGRMRSSALGSYGVREGPLDVRLGFFFTRAPGAFAAVPEAHAHAERARAARRLGFGFWAAGLSLLAGDIVYAVAAGDRIDYAGGSGAAFYALLGGSFLAGLIARDRILFAESELAEATRAWNEAACVRGPAGLVGRAGFEPATR